MTVNFHQIKKGNTLSLKVSMVSFIENTDFWHLKGIGEKLNRGMELRNKSTNANVVEQGIFTLSKLLSVETG